MSARLKRFAILAFLLAGCVHAPEPEPAALAEGVLRVHYVDVGQGDGTLWELPDGSIVVYDCGPPASSVDANPLVRRLRELGFERGARLRALIASHGHLDHVGGCDEVLDEYEVAEAFEAWYDGNDRPASYARFQAKLAEEGAPVWTLRDVRAGNRLFEAGGAVATLLWPSKPPERDWDRIAESSLVVRLAWGEHSFCFQGDIEEAQERSLARLAADAQCDVILVGHHGSRQASSEEWLTRQAPRVAVVSFGDNPYGHPTSEALCRVQQAGATVYATRGAGAVVVEASAAGLVVLGEADRADHCLQASS